jgi:acylphosphatase
MTDGVRAVRVHIRGRVQGVFFRAWTVDQARALGLKGWVRNRRDGSVEALVSGPLAKVEAMLKLFRSGPPEAYVTGIECADADPNDAGPDFRQLPTI